MSAAFYKSKDPVVMGALAAYEVAGEIVFAAGQAFADYFGGNLLTRSDAHGRSVDGLYFSPAKNDLLWTKPDPQRAGLQQPRASLRKATKEQRSELLTLLADWTARFPKERADFAPVLSAMGTDWGNLFFCGFWMFQHDGHVYVSTSAPLAPCMVEILASEYSAAKAAYESTKERA